MFGQIIDLLVKQDSERHRIGFLLLKIIFSATIAAKIYVALFGNYTFIAVTDVTAITDFLLHGKAIICFSLLFVVWNVSYSFTSFVLVSISMWLATKFYNFFYLLITDPKKILQEISKDKRLKQFAYLFVRLFNLIDVLEIENKNVKPGRSFYKFYDYLLDIEDGKMEMGSAEFTDTIALVMQFFIIYNILDFRFLSQSPWLLALAVVIVSMVVFSSLVATVISTLVDVKHSRLLNLMEKLDPDYTKAIEQEVAKIK